MQLALNADTTPLSQSDRLVFKSCRERAREAAAAGFEAVNVDRGESGLMPARARAILDRVGLKVASGFFHAPFQIKEEENSILVEARRQADFSSRLGQTCLFVSAFVFSQERFNLAGRIRPGEAVSFNEEEMLQTAHVLERIAEIWLERDIQLCFHPHVGSYIEAPHEIEWLLEVSNPELVKLGPDTGHLLFGGADPGQFIGRHLDRVGAFHIKDVQREVVNRVRREGLNYRQACALGVWTEIGSGDIDFPALFSYLKQKKWSGWVIVETDHTELPTALESSTVSRRYLRKVIGL